MKYEDFNWEIERDIKMLIDYANEKFKGENRQWTIEIIYWRDKDRMIELRSGLYPWLDVIRFHRGVIKYFQNKPKSKVNHINVLEVKNIQ